MDRDLQSGFRLGEWYVCPERNCIASEGNELHLESKVMAVLAYLSRYTHRVAISNRRLIACDENGVTFQWKDYRAKRRHRYKTMTLATDEFIRRFLIHILPPGFHRIRHYGLLANGNRTANIARARELLAVPAPVNEPETQEPTSTDGPKVLRSPCPCCSGRMIVIETFEAGSKPQTVPSIAGIDSS